MAEKTRCQILFKPVRKWVKKNLPKFIQEIAIIMITVYSVDRAVLPLWGKLRNLVGLYTKTFNNEELNMFV